jgi:hypothetical protein
MYQVERAVLLVKLKQPYLDWTRSLPGPGEFTLESLNEENHAYLIPEHDTPDDFEEIMRDLYEEIFEIELNGWCTDDTLWPKKRDYTTFKQWFGLEVHSIVLDPYEDEIEEEKF